MRINLSYESEIIKALKENDEVENIIVLGRGGGENMEVFNKPSLAEHALSLKSFFITAIGHKEDISLLQKVADKAFIAPTALGQYFNEIYYHTVEELQGSKAKLVEDITAQLKGSYEMQLVNLNDKLQAAKELSEQQLQIASAQTEELKSQLAKKSSLSSVVLALIVLLACAIGILIGRGCD